MKKLILILCVLFLVSLVSAEIQTLGTFRAGDSIELIQNCLTSTYSNISRIIYPNGTLALNTQTIMTKNGDDYNYTFSDTTAQGQYIVYGVCDEDGSKTNWVYDFDITYAGETFDEGRAVLYSALMGIFLFLFLLVIFMIPKFPEKFEIGEEGDVIGVNWLSYLRPIFYGIAWALLLAITFLSSNIARAYIPNDLFANTLFVIWRIMMLATYPMALIGVIYIFVSAFRTREMKQMLERGVDMHPGL